MRSLVPLTLVVAALSSPPPGPRLDLSRPEDVIAANRKLHASTIDGKPVIYEFWGRTYARVPGEPDRLLFSFRAMNIRAAGTVVDEKGQKGYRMVSREVLFYQDPSTGDVLRRWRNPWTGKEVEVLHVANDPVNQRPAFPITPRGPATWSGVSKNGLGTLALEVPLFYPNPLGGDHQQSVGGHYHAVEMFLFYYREEELLDPARDTVNAQVGWTRISSWLPWMEMGGRAGELYFHGTGLKVLNFDQLSEVTRREIETNHPVFKTPPPLDDARPNETSWTYFKKVKGSR